MNLEERVLVLPVVMAVDDPLRICDPEETVRPLVNGEIERKSLLPVPKRRPPLLVVVRRLPEVDDLVDAERPLKRLRDDPRPLCRNIPAATGGRRSPSYRDRHTS